MDRSAVQVNFFDFFSLKILKIFSKQLEIFRKFLKKVFKIFFKIRREVKDLLGLTNCVKNNSGFFSKLKNFFSKNF